MTRYLIRILATMAMITTPLSVFPAAAYAADGWVNTSQACDPGTDDVYFTIPDFTKPAKLTHYSSYSIPPGGSHSVTKTASWTRTLTVGATFDYSATVGVNGIGKLLAKAEAKTGLKLAIDGSKTETSSVSVTDTIANNTGSNASYIFFKGHRKASGSFRRYECSYAVKHPYDNGSWYYYRYQTGTWKSYAVSYSEGAVQCGGGTANLDAVAKLAYNQCN